MMRLRASRSARLVRVTGPAVALILAACGAPGAGQVGASADDPTEAPETSAVDAAPGAESPLTSEQRKILARAALPEGVDVALVEYGAEIFHGSGNCYICHGPDGRGVRGVGANLTDEEWWHSEGAHQDIMRTIMSGVAQADARNDWGAIMPARGGSTISDEEVRAAAAYVWSLRLLTTEPGAAGGA